ncbi:MAG: WhiB family transcriptional regulator [Promicromonosporaceae bacterium]|nr:WhiB family transcriptional regulator [Promicromonosporaceae bacterium]
MSQILPCRQNDPDLWFAEQAGHVEQAKSLCRECPLIAGCLSGALERLEPWGVWGGEVFVDGKIVAVKRGRGRPRKSDIGQAA